MFSEVEKVDGGGSYCTDYTWDVNRNMIGVTDFPVGHPDPLYFALVVDKERAEMIVKALNDSLDTIKAVLNIETDAHTEHCCKQCGCKYGEEAECTVCNETRKQTYKCGTAYTCGHGEI